jgi:glycosyltransferase involved in cell wall biosynthesis
VTRDHGCNRLRTILVFNLATDADDPNLHFTVSWIEALARRVDAIDVVTMRAGRVDLPSNVRVWSVGGEEGVSNLRRAVRFYRTILTLMRTRRYDVCFSHQIVLFGVMAAPFLWLRRVPNVLWYAHIARPPLARVAARLAERVVTSGPASCRLPARRLHVIGQGIDTSRFAPLGAPSPERSAQVRLAAVGRVAPVKNLALLVDAVAACIERDPALDVAVRVTGPVEAPDRAYAASLQEHAAARGVGERFDWRKPVARDDLVREYQWASIVVNTSVTPSIDKVLLEAMACGVPVVTCNPAYRPVLEEIDPALFVAEANAHRVADAVMRVVEAAPERRAAIAAAARALVEREHSLDRLADRLVAELFDASAPR